MNPEHRAQAEDAAVAAGRLGLFTQSRRHRFDPAAMPGVSAHMVNAGRFTDVDALRRKRRRLAFAAKME